MCHNQKTVLNLPDGVQDGTITRVPKSGCVNVQPDLGSKNTKQGRTVLVDSCIADVIKHLWAKGYKTLGSCCGHGELNPDIVIDGQADIQALRSELAQIDERKWTLLEWQLVEVGIEEKSDKIDVEKNFNKAKKTFDSER